MNLFDNFLPWNAGRIKLASVKQWEQLREPAYNVTQDQIIPITNLMVLLFTKVHGAPALDSFKVRNQVVTWFEKVGRYSFSIDYLCALLDGSPQSMLLKKSGGINLVGYAYATTGLGEDIRNLAEVLANLEIPFCIVPIGHPSDASNHTANETVCPYPKYSHSIFCMNLFEFERFSDAYSDFKTHFGKIALQAPWELPKLPAIKQECLALVDSFWCISNFNQGAYQNVNIDTAITVPMVFNPKPDSMCRVNSGKSNVFTFLYIFDARSYVSRKNPQALINAFQLAFQNGENVRLVLKTSSESKHPDFQKMQQHCATDARIHLLCETYSDEQLNSLMKSCDAYVSLHRSEGFGRTLIEAAIANKPVIATGWSGSLDAFPPDWPLLVDFNLVAVKEGEYPYSEGQVWAEVSLEDAAKKMKMVYMMSEDDKNTLTQLHATWAQKRFVMPAVAASYVAVLGAFLSKEQVDV